MELVFINLNMLRPKVMEKINKYLALSEYNQMTIGFTGVENATFSALKRITAFFTI